MTDARTGFVAPTRSAIVTPEGLGRANAASILATVLAEGPLARAEIADRVGLTRATVTRVSNRLIELNLLREGSPRRDSPGRPMIPLELDGEDRAVLTAHFGAHESRVGLVDLRGRVLVEERDRYSGTAPEGIVGAVADRISDIAARYSNRTRIMGVGASVGGWIEPESGIVLRFEPLGWEDVPLADLLANTISYPLYFDQIVRGLALAERMFGAARGMTDFLELYVGNVVGAAIVQDGVVRRGPRGASGTITHFPVRGPAVGICECGRTNCLVTSANDDAVLEMAYARGLADRGIGIRELVDRARAGDVEVERLLDAVGSATGEAAAAMADLVNPSALVVAGVITTAPSYLDGFRSSVRKYAELGELLEVRASDFGDLAPTIASASVLLDSYYRDPLGFERVTV